MIYFLDTEFNGFGGELLSLALVGEDGRGLYLIYDRFEMAIEPWVAENVIPHMLAIPPGFDTRFPTSLASGAPFIAEFLKGDQRPYIVTDWPDDVRYFCQAVITGPGTMISAPNLRFEVVRVDAYPTAVKGAIQHNAAWDAMALRDLLLKPMRPAG